MTMFQAAFIARNKLRFFIGYGMISVFMGILSFGMAAVTMITVKEIYVPLWTIPIVGFVLMLACWYAGYWYEMSNMWALEVSHQNKQMNPELVALCADVAEIKRRLEEKK